MFSQGQLVQKGKEDVAFDVAIGLFHLYADLDEAGASEAQPLLYTLNTYTTELATRASELARKENEHAKRASDNTNSQYPRQSRVQFFPPTTPSKPIPEETQTHSPRVSIDSRRSFS